MAHEVRLHRREWQLTAYGWAQAHRLVLLLMLCAAIAISFLNGASDGLGLGAFFIIMCTSGILFSRLFEAPLTDFLRGLNPRDSVLFFLAHLMVLLIPSMAGFHDWRIAVASLMAFVSFVSVDKLGFGRLHAISLVLVFLAIASQPLGSFALLATYGLCLLLSLRLQHLSERLEQYGEGRGVPVVPAFLETLTWVILPWAAATALFAWLTPRMAERTRFLDFNWGQRVTSVEYFKPSSTNELLRDLLILAVLVAAMIFTVWWFERHLVFRRRSKSSGPSVNLTSATSTVIAMESGSVAPRREDLHDARGRILQRFRSLAGEFARMGFPRTRSETASEFIGRVQSTVGQEGMTPGESMSVFERACYSPLSVTDSEAEAFFAWATGAEKAVNERSKKQKPPANLPDAPA